MLIGVNGTGKNSVLDAINLAVAPLLLGFSGGGGKVGSKTDVRIRNARPRGLRIIKDGTELTDLQLATGERVMVFLLGDTARRVPDEVFEEAEPARLVRTLEARRSGQPKRLWRITETGEA